MLRIFPSLALAALLLISACQQAESLVNEAVPTPVTEATVTPNYDLRPLLESLQGDGSRNITPGAVSLTNDFQTWLNANGYSSYNFTNISSYGGKTSSGQTLSKHPVIFIHGNSDQAVGTTIPTSGWTSSINYFLSQGYTSAELYAITWGDANVLTSSQKYHSKDNVMRIRKFIEAVKAYTGASKVDIVSHSMGVTLCRKAIKGGTANDALAGGSYNVGSKLTYIDAFVGIAGANRGLTSCYFSGPTTPTCGSTNGLYPGYLIGLYGPYGVSSFLTDLNATSSYEGTYRYSVWSSVDEVVGAGCIVYGQNTCYLPGQTANKAYSAYPYGHFNLKDMTQAVQYQMVLNHVVI